MRLRVRRFLISAFLFAVGGSLLPVQTAHATHIRAGEITITRTSCSSLDFIITITVYTNTLSPIRFSNGGVGELSFGDGSPILNPPQIENNPVPGFGTEFGYVRFSTGHTFPGPGQYKVSYFEHNRNIGILNMFNSVETAFYIETVILIDPFLGCDNSPRLLVPPIDKACSGAAWYHNPGAYDPDGDSVSFEMTVPKQSKLPGAGGYVNDYSDPNKPKFYSSDYTTANEAKTGPPTFSINAITGTVIWDAPQNAGEYNIAFIIKEWRKVGSVWVLLGYVTRDMQIIVEDCDNMRPELTVPEDICVDAGTTVNQQIFGTDPDYDDVKLEAFSQVFTINPSPATFTPTPPVFQHTAPGVNAVATFLWVTACEHVKEQPYQVVFKITDRKPPPGASSLVQFKTWNIKVVGPAPIWESAVVNLGERKANLKWQKYLCSNAERIQIWRRIDSNPFTPPQCVTGMPEDLGYTMIHEVGVNETAYVDGNNGAGLAQGAAYCYRLLALYPLPEGGESYISAEICLPPILADAPIVTNVTIDKTSTTDGEVTVKWRPPFDADEAQFPKPYQYEVYRSTGFSGTIGIAPAFPGKRPDTTWLDTGLNTKELVYNYRIIAYDKDGVKIDTSSAASTVRLELKPQLKQIQLNWNAEVPWSNRTLANPNHLIFRGPENSTEAEMVLIDQVNVNEKGFNYLDSGQYDGVPLKETQIYCYRVLTRGGYGNPKIEEPLENYSEIICAQPNDSVPPCKPKFSASLKGVDCKDFFQTAACGINTYSNTLTWNRAVDLECRTDTRSYNIYVASAVGGSFELYQQNVRDTFFIDSNLPSFARCYKISALDRSGNESDLSESFCFDNCPYYELPNVFTPNGDNCNEVFSAYNDQYAIDENGNDACGKVNITERRTKCARFVESVTLTVYNRWGKPVFTFSGREQEFNSPRSIYVNWDGKDDGGADVAAGVYYYLAQVTFDVVDPSRKNRDIKGWVQVIRTLP